MAGKVKDPRRGFSTSNTVTSATSAGASGNVGNPPGVGEPSRGGALANDTPASQEILGSSGGPNSSGNVSKP